MVKLKKLKLNQIALDNLEKRQMNTLYGGEGCGCPCYYSGTGGSSNEANGAANREKGYDPGYSCYEVCSGDTGIFQNGDVWA